MVEVQVTLNITQKAKYCLECIAEDGEYGDSIGEVLSHITNHKIFRLEGVKDSAIMALLKRGKDKAWIVQNIPDLRRRNSIAYTLIIKNCSFEDFPEGVRTRLEEERRQLLKKDQKEKTV